MLFLKSFDILVFDMQRFLSASDARKYDTGKVSLFIGSKIANPHLLFHPLGHSIYADGAKADSIFENLICVFIDYFIKMVQLHVFQRVAMWFHGSNGFIVGASILLCC